jgi:hypothetical protein
MKETEVERLKSLLVAAKPLLEVIAKTPICERTGKPLPYDIHIHWMDVEEAIALLDEKEFKEINF